MPCFWVAPSGSLEACTIFAEELRTAGNFSAKPRVGPGAHVTGGTAHRWWAQGDLHDMLLLVRGLLTSSGSNAASLRYKGTRL